MAISTIAALNQSLNIPQAFGKFPQNPEQAGILTSLLHMTGWPAAASPPSGGLPGTTLTAQVAGQIPFFDPVGSNLKYLAMMQATFSAQGGTVILVDRLWHNSGVVTATVTEQSINGMSVLPARDVFGSTGGTGLMLGVYVWSTTGNNAAITNMKMRFTSDTGATNQIASCSSFPATCLTGTFVPFTYPAGVTGVRQVNGITLGTSLSIGNVSACIVRPIAIAPCGAEFTQSQNRWFDAISLGFPRIYPGSVLELMDMRAVIGSAYINGNVQFAEG